MLLNEKELKYTYSNKNESWEKHTHSGDFSFLGFRGGNDDNEGKAERRRSSLRLVVAIRKRESSIYEGEDGREGGRRYCVCVCVLIVKERERGKEFV